MRAVKGRSVLGHVVALLASIATLPNVNANDTGFGLTAVLDTSRSFGDTPTTHIDGELSSTVATVSINDAPVAIGDGYGTTEGTTLILAPPGVLVNDRDVDGDALSARLVQGPLAGNLVLLGNGSFAYTANPGTTHDSFTYQATDGVTASNVTTVTIAIGSADNAPPIAMNDFAMIRTSRLIDIVANDRDSDGTIDSTSVALTKPGSGTATKLRDGTVRYRAKPGFVGLDSFDYVVRDDDGAVSAAATVHVFVWLWPR